MLRVTNIPVLPLSVTMLRLGGVIFGYGCLKPDVAVRACIAFKAFSTANPDINHFYELLQTTMDLLINDAVLQTIIGICLERAIAQPVNRRARCTHGWVRFVWV